MPLSRVTKGRDRLKRKLTLELRFGLTRSRGRLVAIEHPINRGAVLSLLRLSARRRPEVSGKETCSAVPQ